MRTTKDVMYNVHYQKGEKIYPISIYARNKGHLKLNLLNEGITAIVRIEKYYRNIDGFKVLKPNLPKHYLKQTKLIQ